MTHDLIHLFSQAAKEAPMYLTHTFAHRETLSRAQEWLTRLGFHPRQISSRSSSIPRLMIPVGPNNLAAAQILINVAESADPDGLPSLWEEGQRHRESLSANHDGSATAARDEPRSSVIGWHPLD
jgi:hypothetical protein